MTQTLSKPLISRLAVMRRMPFWAQAAVVCAVFAVVGVVALDDYGVSWDENVQRRITIANADYIATGNDRKLQADEDVAYRYYGIVFEMPLLLAERALGLQDTRDIHLTRHLLTHLFFIAGGFVCGMLAYRMLGSRWIALFAMLLFLLHPRLYAHSFFNTKDIPFAALLIIALYLAHRAFRKDTVGAFLLCGIGVGLAMSLRPFGLMLLPMILAARGLDLWQAGRGERKRILMTGAMFLAAALGGAYIVLPHYWDNPLRFVEGLSVMSQHPTLVNNLFMGEIYRSDAVPWNYIPVWFAITAPPVALLMGSIGCAAVFRQGIAHPLAALRDREIRFRVMLLSCIVLPVAAAIVLQSTLYQGWRQMYFLWGPFCLLAAVGLHSVANINMGGGIWKVGARLPSLVRGCAMRRALAYGVAGVGLITTATAMAELHPHQQVYFNALADTNTPGAIGERYDMDYYRVAHRQLLEHLLARYPDDMLRVLWVSQSPRILLQKDRERIIGLRIPHTADFYLFGDAGYNRQLRKKLAGSEFYFHPRVNLVSILEQPPLHAVTAYGSAIARILAPNNDAAYRAAYDDVAANGMLLARSDFDIYAYDGALYYLNANCPPPMSRDAAISAFLHIFPADPADLPSDRREHGFENFDFRLDGAAAFFDGKCIHRQALPDYPIERIRTQHNSATSGGAEWRVDVNLAAHAAAQAVYESIASGDYGHPVARSDFDVYLRGNGLAYLKENCAAGDTDARFLLHIIPANPNDLPADWRERGFANLDFQFVDHGADIGGKCVAERELPDYPIERIRTGQNAATSDGAEWRVDVNLAARAAAQAAYDDILAGDYGQPVARSNFDVYLSGNGLAYLKENCAAGDTDARFLLHIIPANPDDLPADWRARGFANLDFQFADHGADVGGKCVAERELPDYPIARIRTGQFGGGEDRVWGVDIDLAAQALYESVAAGNYGQAVAQSDFDVYLRGNGLAYLKENCAAGDTDARFFLHIIPVDSADLPADWRERGFANMDFQFGDHGAYAGDRCVATLELPGYAIERIRTGQFVSGEGRVWSAEFPMGR